MTYKFLALMEKILKEVVCLATDKWSSEEGLIALGPVLAFFKAATTLAKGDVVYLSGDLEVSKTDSSGRTDVVGVALKSAVVNDSVPVATVFTAVVKVKASGAISAGSFVVSSTDGKVEAYPETPSAGDEQKILGRALQSAVNDGDEILVGLI